MAMTVIRTAAITRMPITGDVVCCICQTRPSTSPNPWQEPHGSPFFDSIFRFTKGKPLSLAFSTQASQLFPFSPVVQVPFPSQWRHSIGIEPPPPDAKLPFASDRNPLDDVPRDFLLPPVVKRRRSRLRVP